MLKTLLILVTFLAGWILGGQTMHFLDSPFLSEPQINYQKINFQDVNSNIYASARVWGLTSDHEEVRFCTAPVDFQRSVDGECINFDTDKAFYRRELPDRLHIYAISSSIPEEKFDHLGKINVEVHKLTDSADSERNYDKRGLAIIAAP
jgi:hypothetical protein